MLFEVYRNIIGKKLGTSRLFPFPHIPFFCVTILLIGSCGLASAYPLQMLDRVRIDGENDERQVAGYLFEDGFKSVRLIWREEPDLLIRYDTGTSTLFTLVWTTHGYNVILSGNNAFMLDAEDAAIKVGNSRKLTAGDSEIHRTSIHRSRPVERTRAQPESQ